MEAGGQRRDRAAVDAARQEHADGAVGEHLGGGALEAGAQGGGVVGDRGDALVRLPEPVRGGAAVRVEGEGRAGQEFADAGEQGGLAGDVGVGQERLDGGEVEAAVDDAAQRVEARGDQPGVADAGVEQGARADGVAGEHEGLAVGDHEGEHAAGLGERGGAELAVETGEEGAVRDVRRDRFGEGGEQLAAVE